MSDVDAPSDNRIDDHVDTEIAACLNLAEPRSFFLFAGAGSGKTRSLVKALTHLRDAHGKDLLLRGQKIAVITYTNAASDEITGRLEHDPAVTVSTIHSFAWTIIKGLNRDIRERLRVTLAEDIAELEFLEAKGRKGTKASETRLAQIASKGRRLENLPTIKTFVYNPNGDNRGRDSLSHAEVMKLSAYFIQNKPMMQEILISGFPVILVDESQDTSKHLVEALFALQAAKPTRFSLGLLGDMMQRIYSDGQEGLGQNLPVDWATPVKKMNHRCPARVVKLINLIRRATDGQVQLPRSDAIEGHARLFVLPTTTANKPEVERAIAAKMAEITGDPVWLREDGCKRLILEHRMAASRMGFLDMFVPLYEVDEFKTGLLDGSLSVTRFFSAYVLPLVKRQGDRFAVGRILREASPLLTAERLREGDPREVLKEAQAAVQSVVGLWDGGVSPTFGAVLQAIAITDLFPIPDALRAIAFRNNAAIIAEDDPDEPSDRFALRTAGLEAFLATPFEQIEPYARYVTGEAEFDTHQGVKGRQFPRVMVIMDDSEARGFLFKYDRLFSVGSDDSAVRRLFYVICSRAERALALVAYTEDPERVKHHVIGQQWFTPDEIVMAGQLE